MAEVGRAALLLAVGLVATACTAANPQTGVTEPAPAPQRTAATPPPSTLVDPLPAAPSTTEPPGIPELAHLGGRLLVLDATGHLSVVRPDGSGRVPITGPATDREVAARRDHESFLVTQPTWSADGRAIAWTEQRPGDGAYLLTAKADGSARVERPVPFHAVYLAWSTDGRRIAFFGNDPDDGSLQLATAELGAGKVTVIVSGAPIYVDSAADREELYVHAHGELTRRRWDGRVLETIDASDSFRVPTLVAGAVLYAIDTEQGPVFVKRSDPNEAPVELARFGGSLAIVVHPDNSSVAVLATGPPGFDIVTPRAGVADLAGNELTVIDLADGTQSLVSDQRAALWFWSPDGGALLFGTLEQEGLTDFFVRWNVWDGSTVSRLGRILPSQVAAAGYYPFFDQFARSLSIWEPRGRAFVYAGTDDAERSGIWIQPMAEEAEPVWLMPGVFAVWSPTD